MAQVPLGKKTSGTSHEHLENSQKVPPRTLDQVLASGAETLVSNEDRAAALKIAREGDPGPAFTSWRYMRFIMLAMVACVCSGDNGQSCVDTSSVARLTEQASMVPS